MRRAAKLSSVVVAVAAAGLTAAVIHGRSKAATVVAPTFKSGVFDPPRDAPPFDLEGSKGARVRLADFRGKIVALEFGFTHCAKVCPVTLAHLGEVERKLGPAADQVQLIFVTVDPKRDSPERLAEYLPLFHPSFLGATGTPEQLESVREAYGIFANEIVAKSNEEGYQVDHSTFVYLIDREGKIRILVPFGQTPDAIVADIQRLLRS